MASDSTSISGPVTVKNDSTERVALDLMLHIMGHEKHPNTPNPREYVLTLYKQCWKATHGRALKDILIQD